MPFCRSGFSLKRQATMFDNDVRKFDLVRKYFVSHLLDENSELHKSLTVSGDLLRMPRTQY